MSDRRAEKRHNDWLDSIISKLEDAEEAREKSANGRIQRASYSGGTRGRGPQPAARPVAAVHLIGSLRLTSQLPANQQEADIINHQMEAIRL